MLVSLKQVETALEWMEQHLGVTTSLVEAKKYIVQLRSEQGNKVIDTGVLRA